MSTNGVTFRDFNIRHSKVTCALYWLKANNSYYADIVINREVLQSLPEDSPIDDQLPWLDDIEEDLDNDDNAPEDSISRNFIPVLLLSPNEECAITETLDRVHANNFFLTSQILCNSFIKKYESEKLIHLKNKKVNTLIQFGINHLFAICDPV